MPVMDRFPTCPHIETTTMIVDTTNKISMDRRHCSKITILTLCSPRDLRQMHPLVFPLHRQVQAVLWVRYPGLPILLMITLWVRLILDMWLRQTGTTEMVIMVASNSRKSIRNTRSETNWSSSNNISSPHSSLSSSPSNKANSKWQLMLIQGLARPGAQLPCQHRLRLRAV